MWHIIADAGRLRICNLFPIRTDAPSEMNGPPKSAAVITSGKYFLSKRLLAKSVIDQRSL